MIPTDALNVSVDVVNQPSLTYGYNTDTKRIQGKIDGLEAVMQSVQKILSTERFAYVIYDDQYGIELEGLYGKSEDFVKSVLQSRVQDAFLNDERVLGFENFNVTFVNKNTIAFSMTVISSYGSFDYSNA